MTKEALDIYRSRKVKAIPIRKFDISDTAAAYRFISSPDYVGQVVVSLEEPASYIPVSASFLVFLHAVKLV